MRKIVKGNFKAEGLFSGLGGQKFRQSIALTYKKFSEIAKV